MARKKNAAHSGGHGWFVTFADLMGLLLSFFVMLVAFSTPNQKKQQIVAGSMREAFGVQIHTRTNGLIETDGLPTRNYMSNVEQVTPDYSADQTMPKRNIQRNAKGEGTFYADRGFTSAAASLRQALQEMPELGEISRSIIIEETREGLDIQLLDQDGRAMFPPGLAQPFEKTRKALLALAPNLRRIPNLIRITGHTNTERSSTPDKTEGWRLSSDRALAIRDLLAEGGVPHERFESVIGKADTQPAFPDDPAMAANRRISILLVRAAPPLPLP